MARKRFIYMRNGEAEEAYAEVEQQITGGAWFSYTIPGTIIQNKMSIGSVADGFAYYTVHHVTGGQTDHMMEVPALARTLVQMDCAQI